MLVYVTVAIVIFIIGNTNVNFRTTSIRKSNNQYDSCYDRRQFLIFVFGLLLVFLVGLRNDGGADDASYRLFYERGYGNNSLWGWFSDKEPSFLLFVEIGKLFNANYKMLFFLYAVVTFWLICASLKNFKLSKADTTVYILAFMPIALPVVFTTMRQAAAMAIIIYYYSLNKPDYKRTIVYSMLAFLFHYSAIIFVLFEIIRTILNKRKKIGKIIKIFLPIICFLLGYILDFGKIINKITGILGIYTYMNSTDNYMSESNIGIFVVFLFVCYIFKVLSSKSKMFICDTSIREVVDEKAETIEQLQMIYFSLVFLTANLRWGSRIQLFYLFFVPFIFIDLLNCIKPQIRPKIRLLLELFLIGCFVYVMSQNSALLNIVRSCNFWGQN